MEDCIRLGALKVPYPMAELYRRRLGLRSCVGQARSGGQKLGIIIDRARGSLAVPTILRQKVCFACEPIPHLSSPSSLTV